MAFGFDRREDAVEFYDELQLLLNRFRPRMQGPTDEQLEEQIAEGFDPEAPSIVKGIIMMVVEDKLDGEWSRSWHSFMPGTGLWTARGMAEDLAEWVAEAG